MERYAKRMHPVKQHEDPITFWTNEEVAQNFPLLSVIAIDLLIIPGSSAPVERMFSTTGDASSGKRNQLTDKNLEREIMIRKNRQYI